MNVTCILPSLTGRILPSLTGRNGPSPRSTQILLVVCLDDDSIVALLQSSSSCSELVESALRLHYESQVEARRAETRDMNMRA